MFIISYIYKSYNIKIEFINIGGGLGIPYRPEQEPIILENFVLNLKIMHVFRIAMATQL